MGQLIYLDERRAARAAITRLTDAAPVFFFDIASPLSYLVAERVERRLGEVDWVAVDGATLRPGDQDPAQVQALRARAEAAARAMRLPLVWPDRFPADSACAQRAAAFACEVGAGPAFALAASRLAFCGGFDLEDPEALAEAAAAARMPLDECLAATRETWRDEELQATAEDLRAQGITEVPAIHVGGRWYQGESALFGAEIGIPPMRLRSLAPA